MLLRTANKACFSGGGALLTNLIMSRVTVFGVRQQREGVRQGKVEYRYLYWIQCECPLKFLNSFPTSCKRIFCLLISFYRHSLQACVRLSSQHTFRTTVDFLSQPKEQQHLHQKISYLKYSLFRWSAREERICSKAVAGGLGGWGGSWHFYICMQIN